MIKSLDFLLDQNFKKQLLKFLDEACPPKNAFYKTATLEFLGKLAQIILNNKIINDKRQLIALNDVFIEYYSGHVGIYRVKLYQKEASLSKIMDELVFLLESIFGYGNIQKSSINTFGHDHFEIQGRMNEMIITFDLHPNDRNVFNHNNIYLSFWAWTKKIRLWDDIPLTSINNICQILEKFLRYPEIEIISIYKESFFNTSALPLQIINIIENLNKRKYVLKFDKIIEPNINFEEQRYIDLLNEINGCYRYGFFTAMYVLIRKLLENLILDCLRNYYDTNDIKKYYDEDKRKHQNFNTLKLNFNEMINESEFIRKAGNVEQKYIDLLNDFKETGNIHSHSLLSLLHQSAIEDKKEIINIFIQRIKEIRNLL